MCRWQDKDKMLDNIDLTKEKQNLKIIKRKVQLLLQKPIKINQKLSIEAALGSLDHFINDFEEMIKSIKNT